MESAVAAAAMIIANTRTAATIRLRRSAREPRIPVTPGTLPACAPAWESSDPGATVGG